MNTTQKFEDLEARVLYLDDYVARIELSFEGLSSVIIHSHTGKFDLLEFLKNWIRVANTRKFPKCSWLGDGTLAVMKRHWKQCREEGQFLFGDRLNEYAEKIENWS